MTIAVYGAGAVGLVVGARLARAGNDDLMVVVIPEANHLFLKAQTGSMREYATLPKELAPGVLDTISNWLRETLALGEHPVQDSTGSKLPVAPGPVPASNETTTPEAGAT